MSPRNRELYILFFVLFLTMAGFGMLFPVMPLIVLEFEASSLHMGLLISVYAFCQFISAPFWGNVSDRYGRKPVLILGIFGFSLSFTMMGLAPNIELFIASRALGGLLSAATIPTAQAFAADITTPADRASALARLGAANGAGFMIGPILGGALAVLGLRFPFYLTAALALATGSIAAVALKEPQRKGAPSPARRRQLSNIEALRYAIASPHAVLFWLAFVITFCASTQFSMIGLFLADHFGSGAAQTGTLFAVMGVASTVVQGVLVERLIHRYGEERTIILGLIVGTVSFALLAVSPNYIWATTVVIGTASALSLIRPTIASAVSRRGSFGMGITMGMQAAFDSLGRVVGPLVAGTLYKIHPVAPFIGASLVYLTALIASHRQIMHLPEAAEATIPAQDITTIHNPSKNERHSQPSQQALLSHDRTDST